MSNVVGMYAFQWSPCGEAKYTALVWAHSLEEARELGRNQVVSNGMRSIMCDDGTAAADDQGKPLTPEFDGVASVERARVILADKLFYDASSYVDDHGKRRRHVDAPATYTLAPSPGYRTVILFESHSESRK